MPDNGFPAFPSLYTPEDLARQKDLETQRKQMAQVYQTTFEPRQWEAKSAPEKVIRDFLSSTPAYIQEVAKAVTPWEWGYDYGFTPEQNRAYRDKVEAEYSELIRKQRVNTLLESIKRDLTIAAVAGTPIRDEAELQKHFPELKEFKDVEAKWVSDYMSQLLKSSKEDILSGKATGVKPEVTPTDINDYFKQNPTIDPRFILSTVAFSKDEQEINQALQYAYPPQVTEEEAATQKEVAINKEFEGAKAGALVSPETPTGEAIQKVHEKLAAEQPFTFVDDETGQITSGVNKEDYIWVDNVPIGYYSKTDKKIYPISPRGKPIMSKEAEDEVNKDTIGSISNFFTEVYRGAVPSLEYAGRSALNYLFYNLPREQLTKTPLQAAVETGVPLLGVIGGIFPSKVPPKEGESTGFMETFPGQRAVYDSVVPTLEAGKKWREENSVLWLKEHPEFTPKESYNDPQHHPEVYSDPGWYGYTVGTIVGSAIPSIIASIVVTAATGGNIILGALAGTAIMHPMNVQSAYDDLKSSGATEEQALDLSHTAGIISSFTEFVPELIGLKLWSPVISRVLGKNIMKESVKVFGKLGLLGTGAASLFSEVAQEAVQQIIQNAAVKTVDETRDLMQDVPNTVIISGVGMLPFTIAGMASNYAATKRNLPKTTQAKLDADSKALQDAGFTKDHADAIAIAKHAETDVGQAELAEADTKRIRELTPSYGLSQKQRDLERELRVVREDIPVFDNKLAAQQKKVESLREKNSPDLAKEEDNLIRMQGNVNYLHNREIELTASLEDTNRLRRIRAENIHPSQDIFLDLSSIKSKSLYSQYGEHTKIGIIRNLPQGGVKIGEIEFIQTEVPGRESLNLGVEDALIVEELRMYEKGTLTRPIMLALDEELQRLARNLGKKRIIIHRTGLEALYVAAGYSLDEPLFAGRYPTASKNVEPITPVDTKAASIDDISFELAKEYANPDKRAEFDAFADWCEEDETYWINVQDYLYNSAINKADGKPENYNNPEPKPPKPVPAPVLKIIERIGVDVKDIVYDKNILAVKGLKEILESTILTFPLDVIVSIKKVGIDPTMVGLEGRYDTLEQAMYFKTTDVAYSRYTSVHEIVHNVMIEVLLQGGVYKAFTIELGRAIGRMDAGNLTRIGRRSDGSFLGLKDKAGQNIHTNQLTREENDLFMENQARIMESYINDPYILQMDAPRLYEIMRKYFPKKNNIGSISADGTIGRSFGSPMPQSQFPNKLPRQETVKSETQGVNASLNVNPGVSSHMKTPTIVKSLLNNGRIKFSNLHSAYNAATGNTRSTFNDEFNRLAKETGISKNTLLTSNWSQLTRDQQVKVATSNAPNGSIKMKEHSWFDMEYVMQFFEEHTGLPFYSIYRRAQLSTSAAEILKGRVLKRLSTDPRFKGILRDEKALKRVEDELSSSHTGIHPTGLTTNESYLVQEIQDIYKFYEPYVRFMRIENTKLDVEAFKTEFPDAVAAGKTNELYMAMYLMQQGDITQNYDALWQACHLWDWGVIKSGYDPRLISFPTLEVKRRAMDTARGAGRLMSRESISFKQSDKNVIQRLLTYIEQINIQWSLAPDLNFLQENWKTVGDKFENKAALEDELELWSATLQGIPPQLGTITRGFLKLRRTAMSAFFANPMLALRNAPQGLVMGLDRSELFRIIFQPLRPDLGNVANIYYDEAVSEIGGLNTEFLLHDESAIWGAKTMTKMADFISQFGKSEYYPRKWTFMAQLNKADRAMQTLLASSPGHLPPTKEAIAQYLNDSGANHLRDTEKNYLLSHFVAQLGYEYDLGIEGLRKVTGADMASMYIAQRCADIVHFKYNSSQKAPMEMGATGRVLWNLMVFPRSVAQRLFFDVRRMVDPMREKLAIAFNKDTDLDTKDTGGSVRAAWKDVLLWTSCAMFYGWLSGKLTGRDDNPYDILNILAGWSFGGVFVGVSQDFMKFLDSTMNIVNPATADETRERELAGYPTLAKRLFSMYPLYSQLFDVIDLVAGSQNVDKHWMREIRKLVDKDYTPDELKKVDRDLFDTFKKLFLSIDEPDPTKFESLQKSLLDAQDMLGGKDERGNVYTLKEFGAKIKGSTSKLSIQTVNDISPSPSLITFYKECEHWFNEYDKIPTDDAKLRTNWRKTHVEAEAMMILWGKLGTSVFTKGSTGGKQLKSLIDTWKSRYSITDEMMPLADLSNIPIEVGK